MSEWKRFTEELPPVGDLVIHDTDKLVPIVEAYREGDRIYDMSGNTIIDLAANPDLSGCWWRVAKTDVHLADDHTYRQEVS